MFSSNNGGSSLFGGGLNTSTPTSTPTQTNNAFQPRPKSAGGLFGGVSNANLNAVSTPSPSGVPSEPRNLLNQAQNPTGGLFGNNNQSPAVSNGLFGNGSNGASTNTLFGGNTSKPNNLTTGLPGTNANMNGGLFSKPSAGTNSNSTGGLFSNGVGAGQNTNSAGGLFGNSSNNTMNSNTGSGSMGSSFGTNGSKSLFGNSNPVNNSNVANSGGLFDSKLSSNPNSLFGNKANGGLFTNNKVESNPGTFGNGLTNVISNNNIANSAGNSKLGNFSFPNAQVGQNQQNFASLSDNPYGLQIGGMISGVTNMPDSITTSLKKKRLPQEGSLNDEKKRAFSTSSAGSAVSSNVQSQTTLISKLSSRLSSVKGTESIQGLFSPARKAFPSRESFISNGIKEAFLENANNQTRNGDLTPLIKRTDVSEMRKLKIDTGRSAAKKMKLLSGGGATTKIRLLGEVLSDRDPIADNPAEIDDIEQGSPVTKVRIDTDSVVSKNLNGKSKGYWSSPSIEQLLKLPVKQLRAVPNFVIGRQAYGSISFDYDVDLSDLMNDLEGNLFDNMVLFNENQTVEVYPDETSKPPVGYGLNVPATITLEQVYPIDKKPKSQLKDNSKLIEVQLFVKKLRKLKGMEFVSYNPFGGIWTFKVKHFSIWGLLDEEDAEVDEQEAEELRREEIKQRKIALPRSRVTKAEENGKSLEILNEMATVPDYEDSSIAALGQDLVRMQDMSGYSQSVDDYGMHELVEEKKYEPSNLDAEDFEVLEAQPALDTSNSWVEQLKLAGLQHNSIFASSTATDILERTKVNNASALFSDFDSNLRKHKKMIKDRKLDRSVNFAKFNNDSTLTLKSEKFVSGCSIFSLHSTLKNQKSSVNQIFARSLASSTLTSRAKNGYPLLDRFSLTFKDIADTFSESHSEYKIWRLASILFDDIILPYETESAEISAVLIKKERYQKLCRWMIEEVSTGFTSRLEQVTSLNEKIFLMLVVNDIIGATKLAVESKNHHLAVLITLLGSNDPNVRHFSSLQLESWKSVNSKVDHSIIKVYQLLSGKLHGNNCLVNFSKELTWLEILAISLFYGDIDGHSLEELVSECLDNQNFSTEPQTHYSVALKILRCYGAQDKSHSTFKYAGFTKNILDIRFSWLFIQILKSKGQVVVSNNLLDVLTLQYVEQLKIGQFFNEALFTLLFIQNDKVAKQQIDLIVTRFIEFFSKASNQEIFSRLKIPRKLTFKALALQAKYNNDYVTQVKNLLDGELYEAAETVMLSKVAPSLILRSISDEGVSAENPVLLKDLLKKFPAHQLQNWAKGLGVFENYLKYAEGDDSKELLEKLLNGLPILYETQAHVKEIPICCCIMSHNVCLGFLKYYKKDVTLQLTKDKLLALPLGQPERVYLATVLSAL